MRNTVKEIFTVILGIMIAFAVMSAIGAVTTLIISFITDEAVSLLMIAAMSVSIGLLLTIALDNLTHFISKILNKIM